MLLPMLSIVLGIMMFAFGIQHIIKVALAMSWLHIQVTNDPHTPKISYKFSNACMNICYYAPIVGLTLVLIGIKYLPYVL